MMRAVIAITVGMLLGLSLQWLRRDAPHHAASPPVAYAADASEAKGVIEANSKGDELFRRLVSTIRNHDVLAGRAELYRSLANIDAAAFPELIRQAEKLPLKYRNSLVAALFERWLEFDRSSAETWLRAAVRDNGCYEAWAKVDPTEALKFALDPKAPRLPWQTSEYALQALAGMNARARLLTLEKLAPSAMRDRRLTDEFKAWAGKEPAAALAWVTNLPKGKLRDSLEREGVVRLTWADPRSAINRANELIPSLKAAINGNEFVSSFTSALAVKDPQRALEFAQSLPAEFQEHPFIAGAVAWAKKDPLAALGWAQTNGVDVAQDFEYGAIGTSITVLRSAFESKPAETVEWVLALPEGNDRGRWLQYLMDDDFVNGDLELRQRLFDALPVERQLQSAKDFGEALAEKDRVPDLDAWSRLFPNETVRNRVIAATVGAFFDNSPTRAEAILAQLPEGSLRDQTLADVALRQCYANPTGATARALEIRDETARYDALDQIFGQWVTRDRPTATEWLKAQEDIPRAWVDEWLSEAR
jgi:hypothetical protein